MNGPGQVVAATREVARSAPEPVVRRLAADLLARPDIGLAAAARLVLKAFPAAGYQRAADDLVTAWRRDAPGLPPAAVATALLAAQRHEPPADHLSLVWTGPDVPSFPTRRTDQALIEVIDDASADLAIVSFVATRVPQVRAAIGRAVTRGVRVRVVLESTDESAGRLSHDGWDAIVDDPAHVRLFVWPREQRPVTEDGRSGMLHAKFAVADEHSLFVSSANLTGHALALNLELGVLIEGGDLPRQAKRGLDALIHRQILVEVDRR